MTKKKPKKCEECGKETKNLTPWAIYDIDEKKINVKWVCKDCHKKYEKEAVL